MISTFKKTADSPIFLTIVAVLWGLVPAFPNQAAPLLLLAGLTCIRSIPFRQHGLFLVLLLQYPLIQLGFNLYHDQSFSTARLNDSYIIMSIAACLMLPLALKMTEDFRVWHTGLIIGLFGSVIGFGVHYFGIFFEETCRAFAGAFNPLAASFLLVLISPVIFWNWTNFSHRRRYASIAAYVAINVSIICFTGSRMATIVSLMMMPALAYYLWSLERRASNAAIVVTGMILALLISWSIDAVKVCYGSYRLGEIEEAVVFLQENVSNLEAYQGQPVEQIVTDGMPTSSGYRLVLWIAAIGEIRSAPLLGAGQSQEATVIDRTAQTGLAHAHNQFLSWTIWGGLLALLSGIIFGLSPILTRQSFRYLPALSVLSGGAILMTDSLLAWPIVLHATIPILILSYALSVKPKH